MTYSQDDLGSQSQVPSANLRQTAHAAPAHSHPMELNNASSLTEEPEVMIKDEITVFAASDFELSQLNLDKNNVASEKENGDPLNEMDEPMGEEPAVQGENRPAISCNKESLAATKKKERLWSWHQTIELALSMENNIDRLKRTPANSRVIYNEVAEIMQESFPDITWKMVQEKWKHMKYLYIETETRRKKGMKYEPYPEVVHEILSKYYGSSLPKVHENTGVSFLPKSSVSQSDSLSMEEVEVDDNSKEHPTKEGRMQPDKDYIGADFVVCGSPMIDEEALPSSSQNEPAFRTRNHVSLPNGKDSLNKKMEQLVGKIDFLSKEIISANREMRSMLKQMLEVRTEKNEREKALHEVNLKIKREQLKILREKKRKISISCHSDVE